MGAEVLTSLSAFVNLLRTDQRRKTMWCLITLASLVATSSGITCSVPTSGVDFWGGDNAGVKYIDTLRSGSDGAQSCCTVCCNMQAHWGVVSSPPVAWTYNNHQDYWACYCKASGWYQTACASGSTC